MRWDLEFGASEDWFWELAADDGVIPPPLLRKPELAPFEQIVWAAYHSLLGDRQFGFGAVGQIMWMAIDRYAARRGIDGDLFDVFERLVRALDAEGLKSAKADGNENGSNPPPHD